MSKTACFDVHGNIHQLPQEKVQFRPAVYGIFIEDGQILLLPHPQTGLLMPPGSMLTLFETPTQSIRQYFRQLIGIIPDLGPLLFVEDRFTLDEQKQGWHLSALYYALERPSTNTSPLAEWEGAPRPEYIPLTNIKREDLQFGYEAIQAGRLRLHLA